MSSSVSRIPEAPSRERIRTFFLAFRAFLASSGFFARTQFGYSFVNCWVNAICLRMEFLMERVRGRGRDYERYMTFEYLDGINGAFEEFIKGYRRAPVTTLDAEELYRLTPEETIEVIEHELLATRPMI